MGKHGAIKGKETHPFFIEVDLSQQAVVPTTRVEFLVGVDVSS